MGKVTAEGLVKVHGQIEGEVQCATLILARNAQLSGAIKADKVIIEGKVEGPIEGGNVVLKSRAHVVGDITTNRSESGRALISRAAPCRRMQPMSASRKRLAKSHLGGRAVFWRRCRGSNPQPSRPLFAKAYFVS